MNKEEINKEIENLEMRKKQAEALFIRCEGGIEVLQMLLEKSNTEDKPVVDKKK
jgi:hypothetical protein